MEEYKKFLNPLGVPTFSETNKPFKGLFILSRFTEAIDSPLGENYKF